MDFQLLLVTLAEHSIDERYAWGYMDEEYTGTVKILLDTISGDGSSLRPLGS
jgi:hypothetical protein